jgi:hypothetical protein
MSLFPDRQLRLCNDFGQVEVDKENRLGQNSRRLMKPPLRMAIEAGQTH